MIQEGKFDPLRFNAFEVSQLLRISAAEYCYERDLDKYWLNLAQGLIDKLKATGITK